MGKALLKMGRLDEALDYHNKALNIHEKEFNDKMAMSEEDMNFV